MKGLPADLSAVLPSLLNAYPNEGCGVILRKGADYRVRPMQNAYDRYHAVDPARYPRTARTAYLFDPKEWLLVSEEADRNGEEVSCVFHSHADVGAYFSEEDQEMAAPDGEPLFPEVTYLVVAVDRGEATAARAYRWVAGEFKEFDCLLPRISL